MSLVAWQDEALDRECRANGGSRAGRFISLPARCFTALWWPVPGQVEAAARGEDNASHRVHSEALGMVQGRSGRGSLKASCNQSRFAGVSEIKNQPSCDRGRATAGTRLAYAESGTTGGTEACTEVCGLWHVSYPVTKLRWMEKEASAGCSGLGGERPPARCPQGRREQECAVVGGLGAASCSGSGAQEQVYVCPRSTKAIK